MGNATEQEVTPPPPYNASFLFTASSLAAYGLMRKNNYKAALLFYAKSGGVGLNFYKKQADGQYKRFFALDYHPFWNKQTQQSEWKAHYHRGDNSSQMKKHRPYEGGW